MTLFSTVRSKTLTLQYIGERVLLYKLSSFRTETGGASRLDLTAWQPDSFDGPSTGTKYRKS